MLICLFLNPFFLNSSLLDIFLFRPLLVFRPLVQLDSIVNSSAKNKKAYILHARIPSDKVDISHTCIMKTVSVFIRKVRFSNVVIDMGDLRALEALADGRKMLS